MYVFTDHRLYWKNFTNVMALLSALLDPIDCRGDVVIMSVRRAKPCFVS
jgi:hypothetical protein